MAAQDPPYNTASRARENTPLLGESRKEDGVASFSSALFNLTKGIIGIGVLGLPITFKLVGILPGLAMLLLCAVLGGFAAMLLQCCGARCGQFSYPSVAEAAWGRTGILIISLISVIYAFGTSVGFFMVIKTTLQPILLDRHYFSANLVLIAVCAVVVLPLSLMQYQHNLRFTSLAASALNFYTLLAVIARCQVLSNLQWVVLGKGIFLAFPMISLAFSFHLQFLPLVSELKDKTFGGVLKLNFVTQMIVLTFYSAFAFAGYASFGDATSSNILQNYDSSDLVIGIARGGLASAVAFSYPIFWLSLRDTLDSFLFPHPKSIRFEFLRSFRVRVNIQAFLFICLSLTAALIVPTLESAFQFTGAIGACSLCYILPGLLYFRLGEGRWYSPSKLGALLLSSTGCVFVVMFLVSFFTPTA